MTEQLTRTFSFELEGMEPLRRAEGGDGRTVVGIAVPYGVDQEIYPGLIERFENGAFSHQLRAMHRVPFMWNHDYHMGKPVGRIHQAEEVSKGLRVFMPVSKTGDGDDLLTLIEDEVLRELSIGFYSRKSREDGPVTVRTKADLFEVASVLRGAYGKSAAVTGVRSADSADLQLAARQALASLPLPDMIG